MENKFPKTLYETPESWGNETFYLDFDQAAEHVDSLREELGWTDIDISDCPELSLIHQINTDIALYAGAWHYSGGKCLQQYEICIKKAGNDFALIEYGDSND